jgi:hypothetical protein
VDDAAAERFEFNAQKTMYGGKRIAAGDVIYIFSSENDGGPGLIGGGRVTFAAAVERPPGADRHTPRVTIAVERTATARRPLGRRELKPFDQWGDGQPQTELNFKFYRQATNKIVGISEDAGGFLDTFLDRPIGLQP